MLKYKLNRTENNKKKKYIIPFILTKKKIELNVTKFVIVNVIVVLVV